MRRIRSIAMLPLRCKPLGVVSALLALGIARAGPVKVLEDASHFSKDDEVATHYSPDGSIISFDRQGVVVAGCRLYDWWGNCRNDFADGQAPPDFSSAPADAVDIALSAGCEEDWASRVFAKICADFGRFYVDSHLSDFGKATRLESLLPAFAPAALGAASLDETVMVVTSGLSVLTLRNIALLDIAPVFVKYGICFDTREWWEKQSFPSQAANSRMPDNLEVQLTGIRAYARYDFTLETRTPLGNVPVTSGTGTSRLQGLLELGLDLKASFMYLPPVERCQGKFAIDQVHIEGGPPGAGLLLQPFLPLISAQAAPIICDGHGETGVIGLSELRPRVVLSNGATFEKDFSGLKNEINTFLRQRAYWRPPFASEEVAERARTEQAIADQKKLASVGVEVRLGTGRFSDRVLPPASPPPPPGTFAQAASGVAGGVADELEAMRKGLHHFRFARRQQPPSAPPPSDPSSFAWAWPG